MSVLAAVDPALVLSTLALVGAGLGGLGTYRKYKPEVTRISVDAAEGVVLIQANYIERQERKIADQEDRIAELEHRLDTQLRQAEEGRRVAEAALAVCTQDRRRLGRLLEESEDRNRGLEQEAQELRSRVDHLESEVAELRARADEDRP